MKFELSAMVTVSAYTTVEAQTLEEAIRLAGDRGADIGGNCTGVSERECWVVAEIDGEPFDIKEINPWRIWRKETCLLYDLPNIYRHTIMLDSSVQAHEAFSVAIIANNNNNPRPSPCVSRIPNRLTYRFCPLLPIIVFYGMGIG